MKSDSKKVASKHHLKSNQHPERHIFKSVDNHINFLLDSFCQDLRTTYFVPLIRKAQYLGIISDAEINGVGLFGAFKWFQQKVDLESSISEAFDKKYASIKSLIESVEQLSFFTESPAMGNMDLVEARTQVYEYVKTLDNPSEAQTQFLFNLEEELMWLVHIYRLANKHADLSCFDPLSDEELYKKCETFFLDYHTLEEMFSIWSHSCDAIIKKAQTNLMYSHNPHLSKAQSCVGAKSWLEANDPDMEAAILIDNHIKALNRLYSAFKNATADAHISGDEFQILDYSGKMKTLDCYVPILTNNTRSILDRDPYTVLRGRMFSAKRYLACMHKLKKATSLHDKIRLLVASYPNSFFTQCCGFSFQAFHVTGFEKASISLAPLQVMVMLNPENYFGDTFRNLSSTELVALLDSAMSRFIEYFTKEKDLVHFLEEINVVAVAKALVSLRDSKLFKEDVDGAKSIWLETLSSVYSEPWRCVLLLDC